MDKGKLQTMIRQRADLGADLSALNLEFIHALSAVYSFFILLTNAMLDGSDPSEGKYS